MWLLILSVLLLGADYSRKDSLNMVICLSTICRLVPPMDCRLSTLASKSNTSKMSLENISLRPLKSCSVKSFIWHGRDSAKATARPAMWCVSRKGICIGAMSCLVSIVYGQQWKIVLLCERDSLPNLWRALPLTEPYASCHREPGSRNCHTCIEGFELFNPPSWSLSLPPLS
jgi:hypothetical protein